MYLCYYNYPGSLTPAAVAQPPQTLAPPSLSEPLLVPVSQSLPQSLPQHQSPYLPITICRKRPSDDLMSNSPVVTNGTGLSPQHMSNAGDNEAKKVKLDANNMNGPSRVVHLRSLPPDVTDAEVVQLGIPFGRMTNVLLLKQKGQAFLEFEDEQAANNFVTLHQEHAPQIRGRTVFVQFSNHKELKTDQAHSFQNATAKAALQAAQQVTMGGTDCEKKVLRVIVENLVYPVTIDVLHTIFCKFGKVQKMIIFTKNNTFQALIQYCDSISASSSKLSLDNQNIYNGCCTLRIDYSKLNTLNVKYNNDKSRDFTNPNLPSGESGGMDPNMYGAQIPGLGMAQMAGPRGMGGMAGMGGMGGMGMNVPMGMNVGMPMMGQMAQMAGQAGNAVLLVSNLDEQMVTPDALFTLFGVYGDVHRVKILFNKKDNALVQMAEPHQAQLAIAHLDKVKVWGKPIRVTQSKHAVVQMPKEGQPDAGLTKDFTNSQLHRFKRPGSKNCQNIFPPSGVLHLSNIPANVTEEELKEAFQQHGNVVAFKFFPKDRKMALIQMDSPDESVTALIAMHNYPLSESNHLRVSFTKSTI
ncbi:polypyrimidine tract-binding protein 1-like isoform X8 [Mytilus galloprovincialis]|uniref:polypyrimidine tract-binding protein 1-like isoform X14 n=2 Tax=Mytilus edulis TaxID=6550 RepID=UPI0039EE9E89